jgi:hypothetical protein
MASDGTTVTDIHRGPDETLEGAWPREGAPAAEGTPPAADWVPTLADMAPAATWTPEAGIPNCTDTWPCNPTLRATCPEGSAALPSGGCVAVAGDACPAGEWPPTGTVMANERVVRGRADATPEGADGSEERPYPTLAAALAANTGAVRVLLADGEHAIPLRLDRNVTVIGRCAARVTLVRASDAPATDPLVVAGATTVATLAGVTLRSIGVRVEAGTATLRGAVLARAPGVALRARTGTRVFLTDVLIDGTMPSTMADDGGVILDGGTTLTGERVVIRGAHRIGAAGAGTLTLTDAVITGTLPSTTGGPAPGVNMLQGGVANLTRVLIDANVNTGVQVNTASRVGLDTCAIRRTASPRAGMTGAGLTASGASRVTIRGTLFEDNAGYGVLVREAMTQVSVTDSTFRREAATSGLAIDLAVDPGATLRVTGVRVSDSSGVGLQARGEGATLEATRVRVERFGEQSNGRGSQGVLALDHGAVTATDLRVEDITGSAMLSAGEGSRLSVTRAVIVGGAVPREEVLVEGVALAAAEGAIEASAVRVVRAHSIGVMAFGTTGSLTFTDGAVEEVAGRPTRLGQAFDVERGASLTLRRVRSRAAARFALTAANEGSRVTLEDFLAEGTRASPDGQPSVAVAARDGASIEGVRVCVQGNATGGVGAFGASATLRDARIAGSAGRLGYGLSAQMSGRVTVSHARIDRNVGAGVFVAEQGSQVTITDAVIEHTEPGAQDGGYGARVQEGGALTLRRVRVSDNARVAVVANNEGTSLTLEDVALRDTRPFMAGTVAVSAGLAAYPGAAVTADRVVVSGMGTFGVGLAGTRATLHDVLLVSADSARGLGLIASDRTTVEADRVAVLNARGAALSVQDGDALGSRITAHDLYVGDVGDGPVSIEPADPPQAYGVFVDDGATVDLSRAVFDGGAWGFFQTLGTFRIREGVIARQRTGAGAANGVSGTDRLVLQGVRTVGNATNAVARDIRLPEVRFDLPTLAP